MDILSADNRVSGDEMRAALGGLAEQSTSPNAPVTIGPLHITVPATGVHYAFRKLYANQSEVEAFASIPYTTASGTALGQLVSLLATGLSWLGGWLFVTKSEKLPQRGQIAVIAGGTVLLMAGRRRLPRQCGALAVRVSHRRRRRRHAACATRAG